MSTVFNSFTFFLGKVIKATFAQQWGNEAKETSTLKENIIFQVGKINTCCRLCSSKVFVKAVIINFTLLLTNLLFCVQYKSMHNVKTRCCLFFISITNIVSVFNLTLVIFIIHSTLIPSSKFNIEKLISHIIT